MRFLVTGATGYLGWRTTTVLRERGHDVAALARPGAKERAAAQGLDAVERDAGDPRARELIAGCDAVLHFAGVPDPTRSLADPARAVRENAGTTLNLLEGCAEHGALLVLPSTAREASDPYAISKRLAERACELHPARSVVVRLASVFGPGQVAWEGATGAIAAFAARAIDGRPIAIPGDPRRTRDFLYVDDLIDGLERLAGSGEVPGTIPTSVGQMGSDPPAAAEGSDALYAGSGVDTPLEDAARLVVEAAGSDVPIELTGGDLPPGENDSHPLPPDAPRLELTARPLREAVATYVDWLRLHPAAQGRARA
jgi:nucleoside-diphosphate-sugar epimerase